MNRKELKRLLADNSTDKNGDLSATELYELSDYATVVIRMDDDTQDYYYELDVKTLLSSDMTDEGYETIRRQGWSLVNDKLVLFFA